MISCMRNYWGLSLAQTSQSRHTFLLPGVLDWGAMSEEEMKKIEEEEDRVKTRIIFAREELKVRV